MKAKVLKDLKTKQKHPRPSPPSKNPPQNQEQVPSEWKGSYLIKLLKKGELSSCTSDRGITLLSIPGKVYQW